MGLLIKGGQVVDPSRRRQDTRDVLIVAGKIAALEPPGVIPAETHQVIDAQNLVVTPGLIDMHVHLREPGEEYKETIASGGRAAAAGGFTAVATMPNTRPVNDCAAVTRYILEKARQAAGPCVYPVGAISQGSRGKRLADYGDLQEAGAIALSDDGQPVMNTQLMRRALEYARGFGMLIISHCEDLYLSVYGVMHEGLVSLQLGLRGIPAAAEEVMIFRDLALARLTGGRLHIAHVSTAGSVGLIRQAKKEGLPVTAEATPHHFTLTDESVRGFDTNAKMYPPLRQTKDVNAIREGLADGTLDCIATDHAPHSSMEKEVEFELAANGIIGLETALGLTLRLVHEGVLTLPEAIDKLSAAPARILGVAGGSLAPGVPADVTLIDLHLGWQVDVRQFKSKSRNSPFHGWQLPGRAVMTIRGGEIIYSEGAH